jgi:hypothetical protein
MMDGEEVYRIRLAACLAAAEASSLPQVRDRHMAAARSWQTLLDTVVERERNAAATSGRATDVGPSATRSAD